MVYLNCFVSVFCVYSGTGTGVGKVHYKQYKFYYLIKHVRSCVFSCLNKYKMVYKCTTYAKIC